MRHINKHVAAITAASILMFSVSIFPVRIKDKPIVHTATVQCSVGTYAGQQIEWHSLGVFTVTAYAATIQDCGKTDGITRNGDKAQEGITIAADWSVLPEGTKVYVDDLGWRIVQDTGGAVKGNRIDIYFDSEQQAKQFGKQQLEVYVMK